MAAGVLLQGGCVLSMDEGLGNLRDADVLIADGEVVEVGRGLRARDAEVVDATDAIVMPGFVDTHRHTWQTLLRNLGSADRVGAAGPAAPSARPGPDDVYAGTLIGLLSAAEAGITTVVDWWDLTLDERCTEAALQAHADAGLRTVFVPAVSGDAEHGTDAPGGEHALRRLVAERSADTNAATTFALGASDTSPANLERAAQQWALARELGLRIHAHVGATPSDRGTVAELGQRGLLGEDVTLVHGANLADEDLDAIAASGARLALTPSNEMIGGLGPPPMQALIDRGIRPGLGVDDTVLAPGDVFAQMRAAQSFQHAHSFDLKLAGKGGVPQLLSTREVIRYATVDGAMTAGLGGVTGTITPGRPADIVVLRTDRPNIAPVNDPIGAVVWGMDASNVDWVFVAGRALVRGGAPVADVGRVRRLAFEAQQRVLGAGSHPDAGSHLATGSHPAVGGDPAVGSDPGAGNDLTDPDAGLAAARDPGEGGTP